MNTNIVEFASKANLSSGWNGVLILVTKVLLAVYVALQLDLSNMLSASQAKHIAIADVGLLFGIMSVFFVLYSSITPLVRYMGERASGVPAKYVSSVYFIFGVLSFLIFKIL